MPRLFSKVVAFHDTRAPAYPGYRIECAASHRHGYDGAPNHIAATRAKPLPSKRTV